MKVCILGEGLTSLTLAKALANLGIYIDIFIDKKAKNQNRTRTLGISKNNIDFFNQEILNIENISWSINKIEIYSEKLKNEKLLKFENNHQDLFFVLKNFDLYNLLKNKLHKNKLVNFKKINNPKNFIKKNYKLIVNCNPNNFFSKKFFFKRINKNYDSFSHTCILNHKKLLHNHTATQIFIKNGPLAFLPISEKLTSVVYSARGSKNVNLKDFIIKNNTKYEIDKISKILSFELKSTNLRSYYYKNILAFGDLLHKLHPLAGQGFNMTIRDIRELIKIIKFRKNLGLDLDNSICLDFEKKVKHKNYLFSNGIDFVYEFFNLESKMKNNFLSKSVKFIDQNKYVKKIFTKFADSGIII